MIPSSDFIDEMVPEEVRLRAQIETSERIHRANAYKYEAKIEELTLRLGDLQNSLRVRDDDIKALEAQLETLGAAVADLKSRCAHYILCLKEQWLEAQKDRRGWGAR